MALNQELDYYFLFQCASIPLTSAPSAALCYPRHKTTYSIKVSIKLFFSSPSWKLRLFRLKVSHRNFLLTREREKKLSKQKGSEFFLNLSWFTRPGISESSFPFSSIIQRGERKNGPRKVELICSFLKRKEMYGKNERADKSSPVGKFV